jgi:radical SAM protein with 4Fe4S-binding SPASM domain
MPVKVPARRMQEHARTMMRFDFNERPYLVIWEMTRACALACRHCRASAKITRHPLELDTPEARTMIDRVAEMQPGLFILTGGDPMQRPDVIELIAHAAGKGLRVSMSPSATPQLVAAEFRAFKDAGLQRISLSLDGASRETHDAFRGVKGAWDCTMLAIEKGRAAGLPVQINTTFTRQNLGEFDAFVAKLAEIQPALWSVFQLVPTGRGKVEDLLTADQMEDLFIKLAHLAQRVPYDIKTTEGQHYRRVVLQQTRDRASLEKRAPIGINDGKGVMFVSHVGGIRPSGFLPMTAGNVRTSDLWDVYRNCEIFRQLRDPSQLGGKCGRCEFKQLCGGSRARAYAITGDHLAEEPLCSYQPRHPHQFEPELTPA